MGNWPNWLSNWTSGCNIPNQSQSTLVRQQMRHPVLAVADNVDLLRVLDFGCLELLITASAMTLNCVKGELATN